MMSVQQLVDPARWGGKALPGQDELPSEDGEHMETGFHDAQDALLKDTLIEAWAERLDFFVAGNMFVYFSEQQIRSNDFRGPDVFVVLDVEAKGRKSWVAWEEGGRLPDVVIEVTSDSTAHIDRGEKMRRRSRTRSRRSRTRSRRRARSSIARPRGQIGVSSTRRSVDVGGGRTDIRSGDTRVTRRGFHARK
jgi:hypothetical protein